MEAKRDMMKKVPVREQDPKVRATNFKEVCLGYNMEEAVAESEKMYRWMPGFHQYSGVYPGSKSGKY